MEIFIGGDNALPLYFFLISSVIKFGKSYNHLIILIKQLSPSVKRIILNSNINERNVFREVAEKYG